LPPLPPASVTAYPVSPRTGQPRRPPPVIAVTCLFALAGAVVAVAYGWLWRIAATVTRLPEAARLFAWTTPDPVSFLAVFLVVLTAVVTVVVTAVCGALAYNVWAGRAWTRPGGLVALAVTGLAYLLHPYALAAVVPAALAALLLWLPAVRRFNAAMAKPAPPGILPIDRRLVRYGPQSFFADLSGPTRDEV
jgi:hypothetical protein